MHYESQDFLAKGLLPDPGISALASACGIGAWTTYSDVRYWTTVGGQADIKRVTGRTLHSKGTRLCSRATFGGRTHRLFDRGTLI